MTPTITPKKKLEDKSKKSKYTEIQQSRMFSPCPPFEEDGVKSSIRNKGISQKPTEVTSNISKMTPNSIIKAYIDNAKKPRTHQRNKFTAMDQMAKTLQASYSYQRTTRMDGHFSSNTSARNIDNKTPRMYEIENSN